ncbi:hypothetical protein ACB094_03G036100 [Castanea mollissima]
MRQIVMLDDGLRILEEGIVKAKHILIGHPPKTLFSGEDYMKFYNCVYTMCSQRQPYDYSGQLYERYKMALEESIPSVVLPSLNDKHDAYLLIELLQMWKNYKVMTKCLLGLFMYLDHHFVGTRSIPSLNDLAILCFHDLVVWLLIQEQERAGQYLKQASLEKLLEIVKWKLMGETTQVLIQKQKSESRDTATYQDLLS